MQLAKPFIKWVGGKGQLLSQLASILPPKFEEQDMVTYIEPFIGGGAMLFYMLQKYSNIKNVVINDINPDLITCYKVVRDDVDSLINVLSGMERNYISLSDEKRKEFFYGIRREYNSKNLSAIELAAVFIFLNRTCFNGLYRVNSKGEFNVPFGKYVNPTICDESTLLSDSAMLQGVEIICGDFENSLKYAEGYTLFYLDPPYRPISNTSAFTAYSKEAFNDMSQIRLKNFCDAISDAGFKFMLSNSDDRAEGRNGFFDELYSQYQIERVWASRSINSNPDKRGKLSEIVVHNYNLRCNLPSVTFKPSIFGQLVSSPM